MKKLNHIIISGVTSLASNHSIYGYLAAKKLYRADCICHLVHIPFNFKKW